MLERENLHPAVQHMAKRYPTAQACTALLEQLPVVAPNGADYVEFTNLKGASTLMRVGRYIKRLWPLATTADITRAMREAKTEAEEPQFMFDVLTRTTDIIRAVEAVPTCMTDTGITPHPYTAYSREHGWALAVAIDGETGETVARALVHIESMTFVTAYERRGAGGAKDALTDWLTRPEMGYGKVSAWPNGARLLVLRDSGGLIAPYVDGELSCAYISNGEYILCRDGGLDLSSASCRPYDVEEEEEEKEYDVEEEEYEGEPPEPCTVFRFGANHPPEPCTVFRFDENHPQCGVAVQGYSTYTLDANTIDAETGKLSGYTVAVSATDSHMLGVFQHGLHTRGFIYLGPEVARHVKTYEAWIAKRRRERGSRPEDYPTSRVLCPFTGLLRYEDEVSSMVYRQSHVVRLEHGYEVQLTLPL